MNARVSTNLCCLAITFALSWTVAGSGQAFAQGGVGNTGQNTGSQNTGGLGSGGQGTGGFDTGGLGAGDLGSAAGGGTGGQGSGGGAASPIGDFQMQTDTGLSQLQEQLQANQADVDFVGGPVAEDQEATFSRANADGGGGNPFSAIDGFFRQLNALNSSAGNVRTARRVIRAPLRVGFAVSRPSDAVVASRFLERFQRNPILREVGEVNATLEDQTMTLTGFVRSADQRVIVEQQALLEPGVNRVNNQLTVAVSGN